VPLRGMGGTNASCRTMKVESMAVAEVFVRSMAKGVVGVPCRGGSAGGDGAGAR